FDTAQFLTDYVPGFEDSYLHFVDPYFHARGGPSVLTEYVLTEQDTKDKSQKEDVVFLADVHNVSDIAEEAFGYEPDRIFDFPYRQLLPREIDNLIVTGRSAIVQPPITRVRWMVFLMGQAAGIAAAQSIENNKEPKKINVKKLQKLLREKYNVPLDRQTALETPQSN
ncbi:hypothetical protein AKJ64_03410, partial [candidate division MSBL1 archaeon SCGC-AAA259E17]